MDVRGFILNSFLRRRIRFLTTILVIGLLVAMVVGVSTSTERAKVAIKEFVRESAGGVDIIVQSSIGLLNDSIIGSIKEIGGVEDVEGIFTMWGLAISSNSSATVEFTAIGRGSRYAHYKLGDKVNLLNSNNCIVSLLVLEKLGVDVGDSIKVYAFNRNYTVKTTFRVADYYVWERKWRWESPEFKVFIPIKTLWNLLGVNNVYTAIYVFVKDGVDPNKVAEKIKSLGPDLITRVIQFYGPNVETIFQSYNQLLIYIIVGALLFTSLIQYINFQEQRREIGILKTLGASGGKILLSLIYAYTIVGFIGFLLGLTLSILVTYYITTNLGNILMISKPLPTAPTFNSIFIGLVVAITIPIIAIVFLTKSVLKLDPIEIVKEKPRYETIRVKKINLFMGIAFLTLGILSLFNPYMQSLYWGRLAGLSILLPIILLYYLGDFFEAFMGKVAGLSGRLAAVFMRRNLGKSIAIIALIAISISFVATTNAINESFIKLNEKTAKEKMAYDITLFFNIPMSWGVRNKILEVGGVRDVLLVGLITTRYMQSNVLIAVLNFSKFGDFLNYEILFGNPNNVKDSTLAMLDILAQRGFSQYTWLVDKNVSNLTFWVFSEVGNITVRIGAVFKSDMSDFWTFLGPVPIGVVFIADKSFVDKYFPSRRFFVFGALVKVVEGYEAEVVLGDIIEEFGEGVVSGMTKAEWLEESNRISSSYSAFYYLIGYILLLIGLALIIVVEMRIIIGHRREIGILRAIGLGRKNLFAAFILQGLIATLIAIFVIAIDLPIMISQFLNFMREIGLRIPAAYGYKNTAIYMFLTALASAIASLYPSYKIAKENIVDVLKYE